MHPKAAYLTIRGVSLIRFRRSMKHFKSGFTSSTPPVSFYWESWRIESKSPRSWSIALPSTPHWIPVPGWCINNYQTTSHTGGQALICTRLIIICCLCQVHPYTGRQPRTNLQGPMKVLKSKECISLAKSLTVVEASLCWKKHRIFLLREICF